MADGNLNWFYDPLLSSKISELSAEESRHARQSFRLNVGSQFILTDGCGQFAKCVITNSLKNVKYDVLEIHSQHLKQPQIDLYIGQLSDHNRMEWLIEKLQELAICSITFIAMDHCQVKKANLERLHRVAIAAMKQSQNAHLLKIGIKQNLQLALQVVPFKPLVCYAGPYSLSKPLLDIKRSGNPISICIGPEGDFSKREINFLSELSADFVSLGNIRYRTETAAVIAATLLSYL